MIVYAINNYVLALLQKNLDWSTITSKGIIPMLPAQQQPEAMNTDDPFIVYMSSNQYNDGELEPVDAEIISYVIYAGGEDKENTVDSVVTLLKNAFKSFSSAENINAWIHNPVNNIDPRDTENIVTFTEVMDTESSGESTTEGGKVDGFISFRVGYHTVPGDYTI